MDNLVILKAEELIALDMEGRGALRRAARETPAARRVLETFLARGGPIPLADIVAGLSPEAAAPIRDALVALDADDVIRVTGGLVDLAYPFSAAPTPFAVRLHDGGPRYVCCAIDALGIAPMIGRPVGIQARCHHSGALLQFAATPDSPDTGAAGIMVWVGKRPEERCRGIDGL
jgi:hypothetical protein